MKTKAIINVSSNNCNINGWEPNEYRIKKDKDGTPYIKLLGEKININETSNVKIENMTFLLGKIKGEI